MFSEHVTTTTTISNHQQSLLIGQEIFHAAIDSVSPCQVVGGHVRVTEVGKSAVMCVGGREYPLN